jgi:hypothetical protein
LHLSSRHTENTTQTALSNNGHGHHKHGAKVAPAENIEDILTKANDSGKSEKDNMENNNKNMFGKSK